MVVDKIFYNRASANKLGWTPSWFGADEFDDELIRKIKAFQHKNDLDTDGLVGPKTFARVYTHREAAHEMLVDKINGVETPPKNTIVCNGKLVEIDWDKVENLRSPKGLPLPEDNYKQVAVDRIPQMIITHWDVCLSAKSCHRVLNKRGISSHFVIDNDGTIYQMVDTQHIAWHAPPANNVSIGIDLSNAFYTKYQRIYRKRGFGNRPVLEDSMVHGRKLPAHLGYYPAQIEAYKALVKALCEHYDIPLQCPKDAAGLLWRTVFGDITRKKFQGVACHYHITKNKIDTAGLPLVEILEDIRNS